MVKTDCFAYKKTYGGNDDCSALKQCYCKYEKCNFYKTKQKFDEDRKKYGKEQEDT